MTLLLLEEKILKYKWLVARPIQMDKNLATILFTPKHPSTLQVFLIFY
ncbi:hypothetical protein [Metabacillus sediminilitoris]|nr:hypothetical protein [Metabacillus sediminilitoris]QGQ44699.1 hypothetical protein GMB29_05100 [Metabacillus sediminilitoris]